MNDDKDQQLWRIAQKRARFRRSLYYYIAVNLFLWFIWWITVGRHTGFTGYPWPIWVMLGMGVSVAKQYYEAYRGDREEVAQREYEKLKQQQDNFQK
jgi:hypothetical protein